MSPEQTRSALQKNGALRWWQTTTFLSLCGPDAIELLDGICTQAIERIEEETGELGLFLDTKAKIIAPAVIWRLKDADWHDKKRDQTHEAAPQLLVETLPDLVEPLFKHIKRYKLRAKVDLEPVDLAITTVIGSEARPDAVGQTSWLKSNAEHLPAWSLIGDADLIRGVVSQPAKYSDGHADPDALEVDRIEAQHAGLNDFIPGRMPAEVGGMQKAVALDGGCYLGQEPVARLHYRGKANRTLRLLESENQLSPQNPDSFELVKLGDEPPADARRIGTLTTWATRDDGITVALAMLRRELQAGDLIQRVESNNDELTRAEELKIVADA